jgi:hypothetical protein
MSKQREVSLPSLLPLTIILPCAGKGQRFGCPYPKELHCVMQGRTLLDLALAPVLDLAKKGRKITLIVVVDNKRSATISYLWDIADKLNIVFVFQKSSDNRDISGALEVAIPYCQSDTALILPDQFFGWKACDNPLQRALDTLDSFPLSVIASICKSPSELGEEGGLCLGLQNGKHIVQWAEDKASKPSKLNAIWAVVLVRLEALECLYELFMPGRIRTLEGAPAVIVTGYQNANRPKHLDFL